ncbi:MAG: 3,4-dihydroxy-2-butanone-4-phosphate synthase, partial [Desulfobacterales bacterium]
MPHITINSAVKELQTGRMVILADDPEPESSGDLVMAAEHVTAESINFMAAHGRGLICLPMTGERIDTLELNPMVDANTLPAKTGFTVSIEARQGVTTGISAADRAHTIRTAVAPDAQPHDLVR